MWCKLSQLMVLLGNQWEGQLNGIINISCHFIYFFNLFEHENRFLKFCWYRKKKFMEMFFFRATQIEESQDLALTLFSTCRSPKSTYSKVRLVK